MGGRFETESVAELGRNTHAARWHWLIIELSSREQWPQILVKTADTVDRTSQEASPLTLCESFDNAVAEPRRRQAPRWKWAEVESRSGRHRRGLLGSQTKIRP